MARRACPWFRKSRNAWFVTIGGVQHNLGETKKEAFDRYYKLMGKPEQRRVPSQSLAAIVDEFLEFCHKHRSLENYKNYRYRLQRFVDRWPHLRPDELRPFHVEKWADSYQLSKTTRRNYMRAIKRCLRWSKQQGYIDDNPIADLEVPSGEAREVVVRPDEFERILTFVRDDAFRQLLLVAWETGCRPQEIRKVTAAHVDVPGSRWVFKLAESKMRRNVRVVYLSERSLEITKRLMEKNPNGPLFRTTSGKPWSTTAIACQWKRVRVRMGKAELGGRKFVPDPAMVEEVLQRWKKRWQQQGKVVKKSEKDLLAEARRHVRNREAALLAKNVSLYTLRHSWATRALESGIDALTVGALLGHADGGSTLAKVYAHLTYNPQRLLEQARKASG